MARPSSINIVTAPTAIHNSIFLNSILRPPLVTFTLILARNLSQQQLDIINSQSTAHLYISHLYCTPAHFTSTSYGVGLIHSVIHKDIIFKKCDRQDHYIQTHALVSLTQTIAHTRTYQTPSQHFDTN